MSDAQGTYFDDDSWVRRVHREQVVGFAGPRALLLMAAHPVAFEGFFASTGALDDPYARLRRTGEVLDAIAWGPQPLADRLTPRVRAGPPRAGWGRPAAASPGTCRWPRGVSRRARRTPRTTPSCCSGSWPRSSTRR